MRRRRRRDGEDETSGKVTITLDAGTGYLLGSPSIESVTLRDDEPAAPKPRTTRYTTYHDPNHSAAAASRYDTAIPFLKAAGRSYLKIVRNGP